MNTPSPITNHNTTFINVSTNKLLCEIAMWKFGELNSFQAELCCTVCLDQNQQNATKHGSYVIITQFVKLHQGLVLWAAPQTTWVCSPVWSMAWPLHMSLSIKIVLWSWTLYWDPDYIENTVSKIKPQRSWLSFFIFSFGWDAPCKILQTHKCNNT